MSRTENRVFFPQAALDEWLGEGVADLQDGVLTILAEGRRFELSEAVRVLGEVSGTGDTHALAGRVVERSALARLGSEIFETSVLLGEAAYDVQPGWVGVPIGTFAEHVVSETRKRALDPRTGAEPTNDEELMAQFLSRNR